MTHSMRTLLISAAAAALLAGCATDGGSGLSVASLNPLSRDIGSMERRLVETETIASVTTPVPASYSTNDGPRTFFFSGIAPDPSENYWLAEKKKAPVDIAGRVIHDRQITQYLNDMARQLTAKLPATAPRPRIHVLGSPSYEAMAMPTNDIFVSISVLAQAQSEDEIAALLGHEIGHIMLSHHDKDELFKQQRQLTKTAVVGTATVGYLAAAGKSGTLFKGGTIPVGMQRSLQEDNAALVGTQMLVDFVGNDIVGAAWNREQELDADLFGLDLARDAGYNPNEFEYGINNLAAGREKRKTRLGELEALADKRGEILESTVSAAMSQGDFEGGLQAIATEGVGLGVQAGIAAFGDFRAYVADGYTDPDLRYDRGIEYIERFYPDDTLPNPRTQEWKSRRIALRIDSINNAYVEVSEALSDISEERFQDALAHIQSAYSIASIGGDPFPRLVEAIAKRGLNDPNGALQALRSVSPSYPMSLKGYIMFAELEASYGSGANALSILDRAEKFYGVEPIQDTRILTLAKVGRTAEAQTAYQACGNLGTDTQQRCRTAAETAGLIEKAPDRGGFFGELLGANASSSSSSRTADAEPSATEKIGNLLRGDTGTPSAAEESATAPQEASPAQSTGSGLFKGSPIDGLGSTLGGLGSSLFQ